MRKTIVYLVLLAVLAACIWYISHRNNDMFDNDEAGFTIRDTAAVGKIFLAHTDGRSVLLERTPEGWRVNKEYKAMSAPVDQLLKTLYRQVADYPVPESQHNLAVKHLSGNSTKVELYDRRGKKMRVFYVGDEAGKLGTYMLMEGAKRPYVVNIPVFQGGLTSRYSPDIKDWRDRTVFRIAAEDITEISVQYVDEPLNSFIMRRDGAQVSVILDSSLGAPGTLNTSRVQRYLGFFTNVSCEGFTNGQTWMDSVLRTVPRRCIIDVKGKDGYTQHLTVFWRPLYRRSKNLSTPVPGYRNEYDADRYYAVFNNNRDTAVIQQFVFDKIFRNGYEFYQQDQTTMPAPDTAVLHDHLH